MRLPIEKHKRFLYTSYCSMRLLGWFLLIIGGLLFLNSFLFIGESSNTGRIAFKIALGLAIFDGGKYLFCGGVFLGLACLAKCILNNNKFPWVLRHTDKFLYGYAILLAMETIKNVFIDSSYTTLSIADFVVKLIVVVISGYTLKHIILPFVAEEIGGGE